MNVTWAASFGFPLLRNAAFTVFLYREPVAYPLKFSIVLQVSLRSHSSLESTVTHGVNLLKWSRELPRTVLRCRAVTTLSKYRCGHHLSEHHRLPARGGSSISKLLLVLPAACSPGGCCTLFLNCSPQYSLNLCLFKTGFPYIALKVIM